MRFWILAITPILVSFHLRANAAPSFAPMFETTWGQCCLSDPQDIAISGDGTIYIADHSHIQRFTPDGTFLSQWDFQAFAIDVGPSDDIYAATSFSISKFSSSGVELLKWGKEGVNEGEFSQIHGLAVGPNGTVYVADHGNHRIQQFSLDGVFIRAWGADAEGHGDLYFPLGVAVDATGNVYVGDQFFASIQKFSESGEFLMSLPLPDHNFHLIHDVAIGPQNEIYVVEMDVNMVTVMDETGTPLFYWGDTGTGNGQFKFPIALGISQSGQYFVVDYGNNRIQRFGYPVPAPKASWGLLKAKFAN